MRGEAECHRPGSSAAVYASALGALYVAGVLGFHDNLLASLDERWHDWIIAHVLMREAKELIEGKSGHTQEAK